MLLNDLYEDFSSSDLKFISKKHRRLTKNISAEIMNNAAEAAEVAKVRNKDAGSNQCTQAMHKAMAEELSSVLGPAAAKEAAPLYSEPKKLTKWVQAKVSEKIAERLTDTQIHNTAKPKPETIFKTSKHEFMWLGGQWAIKTAAGKWKAGIKNQKEITKAWQRSQ